MSSNSPYQSMLAGGSLAGYFLGKLLDRSLGNYFYFMAPFGAIGGVLMLTILKKGTHLSREAAPASGK